MSAEDLPSICKASQESKSSLAQASAGQSVGKTVIRDSGEPRSVGQQLSAAREALGLTIEAVANSMRIRSQLIRGLEADDFSAFSHPSYARFFTLDYARFLGVPIPEIKDSLPEPGFCSSEGYQYLDAIAAQAPRTILSNKKDYHGNFPLRQWVVSIGKLFLLIVVLAIVAYGYLFIHKLDRLPDHNNQEALQIEAMRATPFAPLSRPAFLNKEVPVFKYKDTRVFIESKEGIPPAQPVRRP